MNKIIRCGILIGVIFWSTAAFAERLPYIALYGDAKYTGNRQSFDYVSPDAPKGGRVVLPAYGTFDNFNPFIFKGIAASQVVDLTLDSLAFVPADDVTVAYPLIAESFELTKDYVGFFLDKRAVFSDGSPILADDVIFSFNSLIEKGSPLYKIYYADVERVEKIADRHVRFWFKPDSNNKELPLIISQMKVYSAADWQGKDFAKPILKAPLGSGPYILESFAPNKYLVFRRNPNYWAKDIPSRRGFYNFDEIRYDYYQDTTVTLQALFAGNIDMREEYIAKIWVTGYDNDLVKSGKIPHFDKDVFLGGAQRAFEIIVSAFAKAETDTLKMLVDKKLLKKFEAIIKQRQEDGITAENDFVGFTSSEITDVKIDSKGNALITVRFVSEQANVLRDSEGKVIEGDENFIQSITDIWTFERNIKSASPNWLLVSTKK